MTQAEYQQLVQGSPSFKSLDPETQQAILLAEGAKMEEYAKLFTDEKAMLNQAWDKHQEANELIIKEFVDKAKKSMQVKLVKEEAAEKKSTEEEAEALLNKI